MSASEKLKALDAELPPQGTPPYTVIGGHGEWAEIAIPYFKLTLALPQIVAVVTLAENFWGNATPPEEFTRALSALEEALTSGADFPWEPQEC